MLNLTLKSTQMKKAVVLSRAMLETRIKKEYSAPKDCRKRAEQHEGYVR